MTVPSFAPAAPWSGNWLQVSARHRIWVEQAGNPAGKPVVLLHGGPGGGSSEALRALHDPARYRIITFDQRGCGRSTPFADLTDNTTWDLVADMEVLRAHLCIDRWQVVGGSWGSTLALAYAVTHPERVSELILRGIFLGTQDEVQWFYQSGASMIWPEEFARFIAPIPAAERGDLVAAYHRRLFGADPADQSRCAQSWSRWEGAALSLRPDPARVAEFEAPESATALARIECHYFQNGCFFDHDGWLLGQTDALRDIPGRIIHGRYDMVTPLRSAYLLAQAWPEAHLTIVPDAGHAGAEPGIAAAMTSATQDFAGLPP
ncbi:MAG: prolyl aminopeptidase [Paracoccaceae bacterium]|nr:prolyl aminopeptidase [Paracoccaceae bacterium]